MRFTIGRPIRAASLAFLTLVAACGEPPAPESAPAVAPSAGPRPRPRATAPAAQPAPTPDASGPWVADAPPHWTPPAAAVAFALRFADTADAEAAWGEWDDLPKAEQIDVVRAGLRSTDPVVARAAAILAESDGPWLDLWEQRRAAALMIDAAFDPAYRDPGGEPFWPSLAYETGGAPELAAFLDRLRAAPEGTADEWSLGDLHKLLGRGHLPALLAALRSPAGIGADLTSLAQSTRDWISADTGEAVAVVAWARLPPESAEQVPDAATDQIGAALALAGLRTEMWGDADEASHREWTARLVGSAPAAEAARRLGALAEFDRMEGRVYWMDPVAWQIGRSGHADAVETLRTLDGAETRPFVLAALARAGDAEARAALLDRVASASASSDDAEAIAAALGAIPADAAPVVADRILGDDDAAAIHVIDDVSEADLCSRDEVWDRSCLAFVEARAAASALPAERLVAIALAVPGCRTVRLGRAALAAAVRREAAGDPDDALAESGLLDDFSALAFLETCDRDGLRAFLLRRVAMRPDDDDAAEALLALGGAEAGPPLVAWMRRRDPRDDSDTDLLRLAECGGKEVRAYLTDLLAAGKRGQFRVPEILAAIATCDGLDADVASSVFGALNDDALPDGLLDAVRHDVTERRPMDAALRVVGARPTFRFDEISRLDRRPEVIAYLERLRERRELDLYAWATAELALLGDADARKETEGALADLRYRWIDQLSSRQLALGDPVRAAPRWIDAIESNCCSASTILGTFFDDCFGWEPWEYGGASILPADQARKWWRDTGGRFVWSRVVRHLVPAPR